MITDGTLVQNAASGTHSTVGRNTRQVAILNRKIVEDEKTVKGISNVAEPVDIKI